MLPFQNFSAWVQQQAAAVQASATALLNLTAGSVLRAILEANASVALWIQWLLLLVLQRTRLSTSTGADVDSWVNDFFLGRDPATFATGFVMLSRFTLGQAAFVPVGAQVKTLDGTQTFAVTADTTNTAYSASLAGYSIAASAASLTVPVQALTAGTGGNVLAGSIGLLATAMPGVDTVTNIAAFSNALDEESDAALRARFRLYIAGLASAVPAAILSAAENVQQGVKVQLRDSYPMPGFYTLYADDGSGAAPDSFISAVSVAINAVTAEGVTASVVRPAISSASVSYTLNVAAEPGRTNSIAAADAAVTAYIAVLQIGSPLGYLDLPGVVIGADPNITGLASLSLNGGAADIAGVIGTLIVSSSVTGS